MTTVLETNEKQQIQDKCSFKIPYETSMHQDLTLSLPAINVAPTAAIT